MHPNTSPAANKFVHIIHLHDTALCVLVLDLRAEDYAVIDRAVVGFGIGVNLMTGETGAGKSQLIDALEMLLSESIHLHNSYTAKTGCLSPIKSAISKNKLTRSG